MAANPQRAETQKFDLEDILGGRVLAWVGGVAIVLGVALFLGMAISRGWIDEPTRVVLAFLGSTSLFALGVWLYERRGKTQAALAAVSSSIAALYLTLVAAAQLYDVLSVPFGLGIAGIVGLTATAVAVRWSSRLVGYMGIVGALLAPVLVGAGASTEALAFMGVALAAVVGVLLWRRWDWLGLVAFAVSAPQLADWVAGRHFGEHFTPGRGVLLTLGVLALYWLLNTAAALGFELRSPTRTLRLSSALLLLASVATVASAGYFVLHEEGFADGGTAWVLALAALHVFLGAFALRRGLAPDLRTLLVAIGLVLSAVGFALALSGVALVAGWAAQAVILAVISRQPGAGRAALGSVTFLALALLHVLVYEAPPAALGRGVADLGEAAVSLALWALACSACARLLEGQRLAARWAASGERASPVIEWGRTLTAFAATSLLYLGSVAIVDTWGVAADGATLQTGQVLLSAFWGVTGFAALVYGLLRDRRSFRRAGLALLVVAIAKVFTYDLSELTAVHRVLSFIALGLLLLAGAFAYQRVRLSGERR